MNRKISRQATVNAATAKRVFQRLEERIDLGTIADEAGLPIRSVQRLAAAKHHIEFAGPDSEWPVGLKKDWPKLLPKIKEWHSRWAADRDDPRVPARLLHADDLVVLAGKVRAGLSAPAWINRLVDPHSWGAPLVPTPVRESPRFSFEREADVPFLYKHMPTLDRRIKAVRGRLRTHADHLQVLTSSAEELLAEALPGLPVGPPARTLRDAVVAEAVQRAQSAGTSPSEITLDTDRSNGTTMVRIQGRVANLPPDLAEEVRSKFQGVVERVLNSPQLEQYRASTFALNDAIHGARKLVLSDSVARAAIVKGSCELCRRLPTTIP